MADNFTKYPPDALATKLYEKRSASGKVYLVGRLGALRVYIPKTPETTEDGTPVWEMRFGPSTPKAKDQPTAADSSRPDHQAPPAMREQRQATRAPARGNGFDRPAGPEIADEIPF